MVALAVGALLGTPALAMIAPAAASAVAQQPSLTGALVSAVRAGTSAALAAGLPADTAQAEIEGIVQGVIASSGATVDEALEAIAQTRAQLSCPSPTSCPGFTDAALLAVAERIASILQGPGGPGALGGTEGSISLPPPPSLGGSGGGGAGYRPAT
jgi:hypothetical protein